MSRNSIIILVIIVTAISILFYSLQGISPEEYAASINKEREEKDVYMKTSDESPFAQSDDKFTGLNYFEPDLQYRIQARLEPIKSKQITELATSDGLLNRYLDYGYATFRLNDVECRLKIFEITDPGPNKGTLFLPFADETSADETYGAGRYLDVAKNPGSNSVLLDFNKAYNPYCAYNDNYSCPFPPRENLLKVAIRAGEKNYH